MPMKQQNLHLLGSIMKGHWRKYLGSVGAMAAAVTASLSAPLVLAEAIDGVIGAKRPLALPEPLLGWVHSMGGRDYLVQNLWLMALALLMMYLAGGAFQYLRGRWSAEASEAVAKGLRDRLYDHLQRMTYDYHVKAETGDLVQRCTSDVETIRRFLQAQLVEVFRTLLIVGVALTVMLRINPRMTAVSMILVPALFVWAFLFFKLVQKSFAKVDAAEGMMSAVLQENLSGVRVVRAFGRQQYEVEKFARFNDDLYKKHRHLVDLLAIYWPSSDFISMAQILITLIYGVMLAADGRMLVGEMTVFVSYIGMLLWPVRQLGRILSDFGKALVSAGRIAEVLATPQEPDQDGDAAAPIDGDIRFDGVAFSYEPMNPVLIDINFTVKRGQTVAILGTTGSGKSTLMHLLQRLYEVDSGAITIGGVDIRRIQKAHLRSRIGLILQEPFLYSRSVRDNIAIAAPGADSYQVECAAQTACAAEFIRSFEKGYDTPVGERGITLSGGQKQRVAIARTLLKQNDILIFDDSLSAVDTQTDQAIREALRLEKRRATTFIISHRLTTLSQADTILVLQNGRITQQGTHAELAAQDGLYRRVWHIQSQLEEELQSSGAPA
jgi:ATP-binding cassette subfamily B protein